MAGGGVGPRLLEYPDGHDPWDTVPAVRKDRCHIAVVEGAIGAGEVRFGDRHGPGRALTVYCRAGLRWRSSGVRPAAAPRPRAGWRSNKRCPPARSAVRLRLMLASQPGCGSELDMCTSSCSRDSDVPVPDGSFHPRPQGDSPRCGDHKRDPDRRRPSFRSPGWPPAVRAERAKNDGSDPAFGLPLAVAVGCYAAGCYSAPSF